MTAKSMNLSSYTVNNKSHMFIIGIMILNSCDLYQPVTETQHHLVCPFIVPTLNPRFIQNNFTEPQNINYIFPGFKVKKYLNFAYVIICLSHLCSNFSLLSICYSVRGLSSSRSIICDVITTVMLYKLTQIVPANYLQISINLE